MAATPLQNSKHILQHNMANKESLIVLTRTNALLGNKREKKICTRIYNALTYVNTLRERGRGGGTMTTPP